MTLLKKGDFVIIGVVAAACVCSVVLLISFSKQGSRVVIKQDNQIIYDKSINLNETVDTGTNTVVIKDGVVYIDAAEHNVITGMAIVAVPAYEESFALSRHIVVDIGGVVEVGISVRPAVIDLNSVNPLKRHIDGILVERPDRVVINDEVSALLCRSYDLIDAIKNNRRPHIDVYEGRKPVDIILASYE